MGGGQVSIQYDCMRQLVTDPFLSLFPWEPPVQRNLHYSLRGEKKKVELRKCELLLQN